MPTLLDERRLILEFADLSNRRPLVRPLQPPSRAPGAHQSDILSYVARLAGHLKPGEPFEEDIPERVAMGIMLEEFYFSLTPETTIWQPGEQLLDGIAVNCDGIGVLQLESAYMDKYGYYPHDPPTLFIEETKCTEKKLKTGEEFLQDFMWMHQGRAYLHAYEILSRIVKWTIWYYRGNWRGSGPVCMQYLVRFSEKEINDTWVMLRKNKDAAMREIEARKPRTETL